MFVLRTGQIVAPKRTAVTIAAQQTLAASYMNYDNNTVMFLTSQTNQLKSVLTTLMLHSTCTS